MRYVTVKNLEPDMILGQEIYDANGSLLMSKHTVLTEENIGFIIFTGVPGVYIDDEFSEDARAEEIISDEVRRSAFKIVTKMLLRKKSLSLWKRSLRMSSQMMMLWITLSQ